MKPLWWNVQQETPDELVGAERDRAIPGRPVAAIVLVAEGHAALVERDEATVRDGDAMGVAGEIGKHCFGPGEGRLGVDEPALSLERPEMRSEGLTTTKLPDPAKEREPARRVGVASAASKSRTGTGGKARPPAAGSWACSAPSAFHRAISHRPTQSYGRADGGSLSSPSCGAR